VLCLAGCDLKNGYIPKKRVGLDLPCRDDQ
jgi:hypothetical protein